ncbi:MAG: DUF2905 domain-containing protein [Ginsengibacter sp.]
MSQETGKYIIIGGVIILIIGLLVYFFHGHFKWFGNLPGDINYKSGNFRFYFPLVTMIIISIVLTIIVNIIRRIF